MSYIQKSTIKNILLTGVPGIGKTTLIKTICELLGERNVSVQGFYTEEVRCNGKRLGFDIVTLNGKHETLARLTEGNQKGFQVGRYTVFKESFESLALHVFAHKGNQILVLDEIGRMELFSEKFLKLVENAFSSHNKVILATIPVRNERRPIQFIEALRADPNSKVYLIDHDNRNIVAKEIVDQLMIALQSCN